MTNAYTVLGESPEEKKAHGDLNVHGRVIVK
jgi:hypothetical protein